MDIRVYLEFLSVQVMMVILQKEDIQNIRTLVEKNQKKIDTLLNFYKKRQFTISGIAQELNRDIFTICSTISQNADTGIVCCYRCYSQESEIAKQQLEYPVRLVIRTGCTIYNLF